MRRSGSAALDLVTIARGNLDLHVEARLRPWDAAAGGLILEEAGGKITDWQGEKVTWLNRIEGAPVLASNGLLHDELLAVTRNLFDLS